MRDWRRRRADEIRDVGFIAMLAGAGSSLV